MDKYLATLEQFRTRCDDRRISDLNIIKIAVRLVNVLEAIHQKGVIHRDLKTTNVMIRSRVRIVKKYSSDFCGVTLKQCLFCR